MYLWLLSVTATDLALRLDWLAIIYSTSITVLSVSHLSACDGYDSYVLMCTVQIVNFVRSAAMEFEAFTME